MGFHLLLLGFCGPDKIKWGYGVVGGGNQRSSEGICFRILNFL